MMVEGIMIIISYLLGCFNTGYYYVRVFFRQDVRNVGTKVTGAYNVSRLTGKKGFVVTFAGDALKGAFTVLLCRLLAVSDITTMTCIFMVILGHIFPAQLGWKGGKGLSTAFGAFLAFSPVWIIYWLLIALLLLPFVRKYTITCLFALLLLPLALFISDYPWKMIIFVLLYLLLILIACRDNLKEYLKIRAYQGLRKK